MKYKELFFIALILYKKNISAAVKKKWRGKVSFCKWTDFWVAARICKVCAKAPRFLASTRDLWNQTFLWWLQNFRSVNKKWPNISVNLSQRLSLKCKWILSNFMKYSKMAFSLVTCWFQVYRLTFPWWKDLMQFNEIILRRGFKKAKPSPSFLYKIYLDH